MILGIGLLGVPLVEPHGDFRWNEVLLLAYAMHEPDRLGGGWLRIAASRTSGMWVEGASKDSVVWRNKGGREGGGNHHVTWNNL